MRNTTHASPQLPPRETGLRSFVRSRPVLAYFALTGTISWGGALLLIPVLFGRMPVPAEEADRLFIYPLLITVAGPPLAALLLTGLVDGRNGLRDLRSRLGAWRVGARWYALASLAAPLAVIAVLLPLSLLSPDFLPAIATTDAPIGLLLVGLAAGVAAGVPEEVGWTGYAVPRLRARHGVLTAGLLLGMVWGVWHIPVYVLGSGTPAGTIDWGALLPDVVFFVAVLPVFRVLMIWVHDRTHSVPVAMIMHGSLSATAPLILAPGVTGTSLAVFYLALAALMGAVVAVGAAKRESVQEIERRAV
jgi:uncharacterized protein